MIKRHKRTGNKDLDRTIINLQKQIDELKRNSHPKTTSFDKLILSNTNKFRGNSFDFLSLDRMGNVGRRKAISYACYNPLSARMNTVNRWSVGVNDLGTSIGIADIANTEMKECMFISPEECFLKSATIVYSVNTASKFGFAIFPFRFTVTNNSYIDEADNPTTIMTPVSTMLYGGNTHDTSKIYIQKLDCNLTLPKFTALFAGFRYTTNSGTHYLYPEITLEFEQ